MFVCFSFNLFQNLTSIFANFTSMLVWFSFFRSTNFHVSEEWYSKFYIPKLSMQPFHTSLVSLNVFALNPVGERMLLVKLQIHWIDTMNTKGICNIDSDIYYILRMSKLFFTLTWLFNDEDIALKNVLSVGFTF